MKKMKKWMAVFLTCLMLVPTLAACKREEAPEGNTGNSNAAGNVNTNLKGTVAEPPPTVSRLIFTFGCVFI